MAIYMDTNDTVNRVYKRDEDLDMLLVLGTTVPTDTADGYAKGCTFIDTDVATGTGWVYFNKGTNASCVFTLVTQG